MTFHFELDVGSCLVLGYFSTLKITTQPQLDRRGICLIPDPEEGRDEALGQLVQPRALASLDGIEFAVDVEAVCEADKELIEHFDDDRCSFPCIALAAQDAVVLGSTLLILIW